MKRRKVDAGLSPEYLREKARRALMRGRQWVQRAEALYREADKREAKRDELALGPWPREFCEACKAHGSCRLHPDAPPLPIPAAAHLGDLRAMAQRFTAAAEALGPAALSPAALKELEDLDAKLESARQELEAAAEDLADKELVP